MCMPVIEDMLDDSGPVLYLVAHSRQSLWRVRWYKRLSIEWVHVAGSEATAEGAAAGFDSL